MICGNTGDKMADCNCWFYGDNCKPTQDKCLSLTAGQVREIGERCWPQGGSHFAKGIKLLRATWLADTDPWR